MLIKVGKNLCTHSVRSSTHPPPFNFADQWKKCTYAGNMGLPQASSTEASALPWGNNQEKPFPLSRILRSSLSNSTIITTTTLFTGSIAEQIFIRLTEKGRHCVHILTFYIVYEWLLIFSVTDSSHVLGRERALVSPLTVSSLRKCKRLQGPNCLSRRWQMKIRPHEEVAYKQVHM